MARSTPCHYRWSGCWRSFMKSKRAATRSRAADRATLGRLPVVILISMTFEIPFVALSLAVCFTVFSRTRFTPNLSRSCLCCHGAGDRQPVFDLQMVIRRTLIRLIIAGPILMGCMFLMRPIAWGWSFSPSPLSLFTGKPPRHARLSGSGRALNAVVYRFGLYPTLLMTLIGVLWFPSRPFRKCIRRLMIGLMMPLVTCRQPRTATRNAD